MQLGKEVGLGPGHIMLDGDPLGTQPPHISPSTLFGWCLLWPNGRQSQQLLSFCLEFWYVCVSGMWRHTFLEFRCYWFWQQFQTTRVQNCFCAKQENWQQYILIYSEVRTQIEIVQCTPVNWKLYKTDEHYSPHETIAHSGLTKSIHTKYIASSLHVMSTQTYKQERHQTSMCHT